MTLDGFFYCADFARRHDRERYLCALFAPESAREAVLTLLAFNAELALIPESTREATMGYIRFAWWREVVQEIYGGARVRHHPVAEGLKAAVVVHALSRGFFDTLLDTREADLERDDFANLETLVAHAQGCGAPLLTLCLEAIGIRGETASAAAREVGTAYALAGLLRSFPYHVRRGRIYLPDIFIGEEAEDELMEGRFSPDLGNAIRQVAERAELHLKVARTVLRELPKDALFLKQVAALAGDHLRRLKHVRYDVFALEKKRPSPFLPLRLIVRSLFL